jgi:polyisoprenoid-binding protein YceI
MRYQFSGGEFGRRNFARRKKNDKTMKTKLLLALALSVALFSSRANAQTSTWTIDPAHSSVNFDILHMGVSHVHGAFSNVKGTVTLHEKDITKSTVAATIDTTTVSTGNEARDKHLKSADFFDVEKNPALTFQSTSLRRVGGKLQLIGNLTINGVAKSVTLDVDGPTPPQTMQGKTISGFSASGIVKRSEFGFGAKFPPPLLGDEVKFTIDVEIDKQ